MKAVCLVLCIVVASVSAGLLQRDGEYRRRFELALERASLNYRLDARVPPLPPDVVQWMDLSADPCNDFYEYSCGTWINKTVLPPSQPIVLKAITSISDTNEEVLKDIVKKSTNPKVLNYFANCMDRSRIDKRGLAPLQPFLDAVSNFQSLDDVMYAVGNLHKYSIGALFSVGIVADANDPTINILEFDQGGSLLPRELYMNASELLSDYLIHIQRMFVLANNNASTALLKAEAVLETETILAQCSLPLDQIRDPFDVYHRYNMDQLKSLTPSLSWSKYLRGMASLNQSQIMGLAINVAEPQFFQCVNDAAVHILEPFAFEAYLQWQLIHSLAASDLLPQGFVNENFNFFGVQLDGQSEITPLDSRCIDSTGNALGDILAAEFIKQRFSPSAKDFTHRMVEEIEEAFRVDLVNLDWMDDQTRQQAITKLSMVTQRVGYPDHFNTYDGFNPQPGMHLESGMEARRQDWQNRSKSVMGPVDRSLWEMFAYIVNAYYEPTSNSVNFPAGILQTPYFNLSADPAINFGGSGVIMGHELTHGFDDQGRMYDGSGRLVDWWQNATAQQFINKAQCLVDQYNTFQPIPGVFVNGLLTLGENIADNGGVKMSLSSYVALVGQDKANLPLFFVAYAQNWCAKATDEYIRYQIQTNPHSPAKFRAIGPLINSPAFATTFNCPAGSYMNPTHRCEVW